jgi:TolB protein
MKADGARPGATVTQLTSTGRSEDPSWAPDGRHIVYTGVGANGPGLYVIDVITGEIRQLVSGRSLRTPDWSGSLARSAAPGSRP